MIVKTLNLNVFDNLLVVKKNWGNIHFPVL